MNIIVGHTNMDLDCLGSMILAKRLFPDYKLVKSRLVHPVAKNLYNLYQNHFEFLNPKDLKGEVIEKVLIVDTSTWSRVKEYFAYIEGTDPEIEIYDHHPADACDIEGAILHSCVYGSNTTSLGEIAMERNIDLSPEEATIALTGIYADTGRYIHENVSPQDFNVSAYLLEKGASLKLVKSFLATLKEDFQKDVLHELMNKVKFFDIQGHNVLLSYMGIESNTPGLAAVVEKIMEIENPDAYFAIFHIQKNNTALVIARSQKDRIDLHDILTAYGGGGHLKAGSAKVEANDGPEFFADFLTALDNALTPALRAKDIMTTGVFTIHQQISLLDASLYLEEIDHSGLPVVDDDNHAVGFLTLLDIMKGRRGKQMHAPVKAYMSRKLVTAQLSTTIREVERIFYKHHIGHLPIIEDQKIVGIVTRWDYLQFKRRKFQTPHDN